MNRPDFKVQIAGGRDFDDYSLLWRNLDLLLSNKATTHNIVIVSGGARGADYLGEVYAEQRGYEVDLHPADWGNIQAPNAIVKTNKFNKKYNALAGMDRNISMAKACDASVIFWDGVSTGTKNMIDLLNKEGKPCRVFEY